MMKVIELFTYPIMFLNMFSLVIGGIWLAFIGDWKLIGIGVFLLFTSHWILSLLMLPKLGLSALALSIISSTKNPFLYIITYLSQLYLNILIVLWCLSSFLICTSYYGIGHYRDIQNPIEITYGLIPYLLWSWSMALSPWQFFVSKEPDNEFSMATTYIVSILYFLFLFSALTMTQYPAFTVFVHFLSILILIIILPFYYIYSIYVMD